MTFADSRILALLLLIIPALIAFLFWAWRVKQRLTREFVQNRLLPTLTVGVFPGREKFKMAMLVTAVALLLIAVARPQAGFTWEEIREQGLDVVIAIDTSRSMLAADVVPNRLTRARLGTLDLLRLTKGDRVGLVAFAGSAFLQCPLTLDRAAFEQNLQVLSPDIIPQGGSSIAAAIDTARKAFDGGTNNHKILVIFTDGEDHEGAAVESARLAANEGVRIFTVGVGTSEGELIRVPNGKGGLDFLRDEQGNVVKSRLNEQLLKEVAAVGKGFHLPLRGVEAMETLYQRGLAPLPQTSQTEKKHRMPRDQYYWPAAGALLLLVGELFISHRRTARPRKPAKTTASIALPLFLLLQLPLSGTASVQQAQKAYRNGEYSRALQAYEEKISRGKSDPKLAYNAGTAAYRAGELDRAEQHLLKATESPEPTLQQRAFYNLGNALFRKGEQQEQPTGKQTAWEQAAKHFETALNLNRVDTDSRHNLDLVRRRLAELKRQQEQQQQQPKDQKKPSPKNDPKEDSKDKQQQENQKPGDSEKKEQPPKPNKKSDQPAPDEKSDQAQNQPDQPPKPGQTPGDKGRKDKEGEQKPEGDPGDAAAAQGRMSAEQVDRFLDALRQDESALIFGKPGKTNRAKATFKDW